MKRIFKLILVVLATLNFTVSTVQAQSPEKMTYQAVVRNASNNLVTNTAVGIEINILQGTATGTQVYTETQTPTTNYNGLLTIEIGGQTGFDTITWANGPYFLETNIDPDNSGSYTITGVSQLLTVPYALHAKTAESITGGITETDPAFTAWDKSTGINITESQISDLQHFTNADETDPVYSAWDKSYIDLTNTPNITDTVIAVLDTTTQFIRAENQNLADVLTLSNDGNAMQIKNIANPTDSQDVVTVSYLDSYTHGSGNDDNLVLWNKLGNETEVLNSEIGENGELVGTGHNYEAAKFDNGYVRTNTSSYVKFPASVLEARRTSGTIEFWVVPKVSNPMAYHYGAYMLVGYDIGGNNTLAFVRWGDGTTGLGISGGVNFDGTTHRTPEESQQFVATVGEPFHIALVWDVNGIDGTSETIRIYRGDSIIGTSTDTWDANATTTYDKFYIGTGPDNEAYDKYIMDNIKVWNYAKTDYSDMDTEHQTGGLYTAGTGIEIENNVISTTKPKFYLGQDTLGGIVYHIYLDANGEQHGLIVSKTETSAKWQNTGTTTNATRSWDGTYNTNLMSDSPAKDWITTNFTSEWYLPSIDELSFLWHSRYYVNKALNGTSSTLLANSARYCSSTEFNVTSAFYFHFTYGNSNYDNKTYVYSVRAVRAF